MQPSSTWRHPVDGPVLGQGQYPPRAAQIIRRLLFQPKLGHSFQAAVSARALDVVVGENSILSHWHDELPPLFPRFDSIFGLSLKPPAPPRQTAILATLQTGQLLSKNPHAIRMRVF